MGIGPRRDAPVITASRELVLEAIRKVVPVGRSTVLVAIDGRGGAGKTSLAAWLAHHLSATVIHTDDFASTQATGWGWGYVRDRVLEPLRSDQVAVYAPLDWHSGRPLEEVSVSPGGVVILEGVSASRIELGGPWDVTVWVDCPAEVGIARGLERDGADALNDWMRWEAEENAFFAAQPLYERAQFVVDGLEGA